MPTAAEAWNSARDRAVARMLAEARLCGADAVVGVSIRQAEERMPVSSGGSVECVATGTAVACDFLTAGPPGPVLTNLSVQDFWKLLQQGIVPVGVVAVTTVFGCVPSQLTYRSEAATILSAVRRTTREIPGFSKGLRLAHREAFAQMRSRAERMGAEGVVGVTIDREQHSAQPSGHSYKDLIVSVHAIGTAIAHGALSRPPAAS